MSVHAGTNVGYFPILTIRGLSLVGVHIVWIQDKADIQQPIGVEDYL